MSAALSALALVVTFVLATTTSTTPVLRGVLDGEGSGDDPVTVISLTDAGGERTPVATAGLVEVAASGSRRAPGPGRAGGMGATLVGAAVPVLAAGRQDEQPEVDDVAVLTPAMATPEFFVAGLSWHGPAALGHDVHAFVRTQEPSGWTEWVELEPDSAGPDELPEGAASGTDPVITAGARGIQVQLSGDPAELPADLQVSLVPAQPGTTRDVVQEPLPEPAEPPTHDMTAPAHEHEDEEGHEPEEEGHEEGEAETETPPAAQDAPAPPGAPAPEDTPAPQNTPAPEDSPEAADAAGRAVFRQASSYQQSSFRLASSTGAGAPTALGVSPLVPNAVIVPEPLVVTRSGWGVDESIPEEAGTGPWTVRYSDVRAGVVHHTAGSNRYSAGDSAAIVRGIYHYHAVTRGWGDIGYNFLVDRFGRVFEGRKGTLQSEPGEIVTAGHARGYNVGTVGISVMGNFVNVSAPAVSLDRIATVFAWQFARSGVDLSKSSGLISPGTPTRPAGQLLPRVFGHKDVASTSCPGTIHGRIPEIAKTTRSRMPQLHYLNNSFTAQAHLTFYYGDLDAQVLVGDWDNDGTDTLAVRRGRVYYIKNSNTYGSPDAVIPYGRAGDQILVGDWNGDGTDTLAVRRGRVYYIKNRLTSGPADRVIAYGRAGDQVLVGDWNGDGTDTLAVRRGRVYYIKNSLTSGPADRVVPYGRAGDRVLVGDWDGDGTDSLGVRRLS